MKRWRESNPLSVNSRAVSARPLSKTKVLLVSPALRHSGVAPYNKGMSLWVLALIVFNLFMVLALAILWIRQTRPAKEDPRLSRGLQLLQSKIAVLEDLSDRTENQVRQLTRILDERSKALQTKMLQAEETILKIESSMRKSLDVAEIFQDKIPHQEIIERDQQSKYVLAAKLAHEGQTAEQIAATIDLPISEIEFIAKVNKEELTFNPDLLPEWAKSKLSQQAETNAIEQVFSPVRTDYSSLNKIEADFKQSVRDAAEAERLEQQKQVQAEERVQAIKDTATQMTKGFVQVAKSAAEQAKPLVRKVQFPRINIDKP